MYICYLASATIVSQLRVVAHHHQIISNAPIHLISKTLFMNLSVLQRAARLPLALWLERCKSPGRLPRILEAWHFDIGGMFIPVFFGGNNFLLSTARTIFMSTSGNSSKWRVEIPLGMFMVFVL